MNHNVLWNTALESLEKSIPGHAISAWFESLKPVGFSGGKKIIIEVPNKFTSDWIESHYKDELLKALNRDKNNKLTYLFKIASERLKDEPPTGFSRVETKTRAVHQNNLNTQYQFKNFIEGSNNEFAKNAAVAVSRDPGGNNYNPLIIYGGVGLGKTHLMHAIGNSAIKKNPKLKVVVVTSETFTLDFVNSLRKNKTIEFAQQYRAADILLIDDIQFFRGKEQTQEQFFHTFNVLHQSRKQIVMTADKSPNEMRGLQARLLSRFESGLSADIQPPNFELRVAILLEKAEQNGLALRYDIIEFIARYIKNNVRDLEGTIIRVLAKSSLLNKEIDFNLVKEVVKERLGNSFSNDITIESIVKKVSQNAKIPEKDIVGKSRRVEIAQARQVSMFLCRDLMGISLSNIGIYFGGRDHTTVMHAVKKISKKYKQNEKIRILVNNIRQEMDDLL